MSKELEEPALEGTIVDPVIPIHYWGFDGSNIMASTHVVIEGDRVFFNTPGFTPGDFHENA